MSKRQRRRYDDEFRAGAVVMLEAAGYPDKKGSLSQVASHLGMPISTLSLWYRRKRNPAPTEMQNEKRMSLAEMLQRELDAIFEEMPNARPDASFRDLGTVAGILIDKRQLLTGQPTDRTVGELIIKREGDDYDTFTNTASRATHHSKRAKPVQRSRHRQKVG